jgi:hypothetical protein
MSNPPQGKPKIAVFSGPTATIQNTQPLVTSNKARQKYGIPLLADPDGQPPRFDALRPQRLAAPVTVYIEQFSAHPLERDAANLYAPPDGYLDSSGVFHQQRRSDSDVPVFEVTLAPEDGLYPLPYMARQADGEPWEGDGAHPGAPGELCRQPFYADASRLFEEIDRMGLGERGVGNLLSSRARFDFYRAAPSGGYRNGLPAVERTDVGEGDIPPETLGEDFFPYRPRHLRTEPPRRVLAKLTNMVQRALSEGEYAGGIWLEGTPSVEETTYWLNLLIDTRVPIVGNASQRTHGSLGNDGDHNIVGAVEYLLSRIWADEAGDDRVGVVVLQDQRLYTSREVQKGDARPGGYVATGGHGGIVGAVGGHGHPVLTFVPTRRHTHRSEVNVSRIPTQTRGSGQRNGRVVEIPVQVKDERGDLVASAIPSVTYVKHGRYLPDDAAQQAESEVDILARIDKNLREAPLAGFVAEGTTPSGALAGAVIAALTRAVYSGMPVVTVSRGNAEGFSSPNELYPFVSGSNLTATKARLLMMAALLRFGCLPVAADPANPTEAEREATRAKLAALQSIFDTH